MEELIAYGKLVLFNKSFMWLLFVVNLLGTIYGYIWYESQLSVTEPKFLLFVPDSPTASLFFTIALFGWLMKKNWKLIEALALITLVKYGVWAVVMNIWTYMETGSIGWMGWMLVVSHFAMALQAILYIPFYRFTFVHIFIAAVWTLHNDVIDYVFGQMPVYRSLSEYASQIGYFTFWLSIACISIAIGVYQKWSKRIS
ncbi:DUF1405 domain-containing protein [Psychrobacillus lasiicapitis]|uniref:DUF1405 domain-containing protein n=1 Tax=Psychrobacillus lasiicapitis TaxID=1636719 RepID=A0A544THM1_9BACI|nr:DUF1405 domain-containing protein [Psychrobacillus lasiicapitis]TQR16957.1 DUF1405 domain-containing protein [Psychrobacillus lasiicapitis]GGA25772.1 hypothetical protein GCM10011384_13720 [Psychrobacillus lasiicapitis]